MGRRNLNAEINRILDGMSFDMIIDLFDLFDVCAHLLICFHVA